MIIFAISGEKREIFHQKMMRNPRFFNEISHTLKKCDKFE